MDLLAETLAALDLNCAVLTEALPDGRLRTLRFLLDGAEAKAFTYDPAEAPCADVLRYGFFLVANGVQVLYPGDRGLARAASQCYLGLRREDGGHLALLGRQPWHPGRLDDHRIPALLGREFTEPQALLATLLRRLEISL